MIWFGDWDVPDPRITNQHPIGQISLFIHNPDNAVEEGPRRIAKWAWA
jgi:hypothetical protein